MMNISLKQLDDLNDKITFNKSHYKFNKHTVPRVTEIISKCTHEDYLMRWANVLGMKGLSYERTLNNAARYGTEVHSAIEHYLKEGTIEPNTPIEPITAFEKWWKVMQENSKDLKVKGQEFKLSCPWFGGTYDMLLEKDNKLILVDFKTSNRISFKYLLQLAAYEYLLEYNKICNIDEVLILRLYKTSPNYETFVLDLSDPEMKEYFRMCRQTFFSMVMAYYGQIYVSDKFNKIQKTGCAKLWKKQPDTNKA